MLDASSIMEKVDLLSSNDIGVALSWSFQTQANPDTGSKDSARVDAIIYSGLSLTGMNYSFATFGVSN